MKYRKGRGYQFVEYTDAAHRIMSIVFALVMFFVSAILTGQVFGNDMNVYVGIISVTIMAIYLDFSLSKTKMLKYRYIYPDARKYMLYYFLFLIALISLAGVCSIFF